MSYETMSSQVKYIKTKKCANLYIWYTAAGSKCEMSFFKHTLMEKNVKQWFFGKSI